VFCVSFNFSHLCAVCIYAFYILAFCIYSIVLLKCMLLRVNDNLFCWCCVHHLTMSSYWGRTTIYFAGVLSIIQLNSFMCCVHIRILYSCVLYLSYRFVEMHVIEGERQAFLLVLCASFKFSHLCAMCIYAFYILAFCIYSIVLFIKCMVLRVNDNLFCWCCVHHLTMSSYWGRTTNYFAGVVFIFSRFRLFALFRLYLWWT